MGTVDWAGAVLPIGVGVGEVGFLEGGRCFHFFTIATVPKMYSVLLASSDEANVPSGSSKANESEDIEPGLYESGGLTHEGRCVIVREA